MTREFTYSPWEDEVVVNDPLGTLSVLNCGVGDLKFSFDPKNPTEVARAKKTVSDMLARGYILMVDIDGTLHRVKKFDHKNCEYIVLDPPEKTDPVEKGVPTKKKPGRPRGVPASKHCAVAVAPVAGGAPTWDALHGALNDLAMERSEWAGSPMPIEGIKLVIEPRYPNADRLNGFCFDSDHSPELPQEPSTVRVRNSWYSVPNSAMVYACDDGPDTKAFHVMLPEWGGSRLKYWIRTLGTTKAWPLDAEYRAIDTLSGLITPHAFKSYVCTGSFLETSKRSGMTYLFRRLRPTVAMRGSASGGMRIAAVLCMHCIGYYEETWAGVMCPTDDLMTNLLMMRCDERRFWAKANHHPSWSAAAGI